jgi:hypothetical protein
VDDPRVQKLIPVLKYRWSALVSFAGLAAAPGIPDVGDWLSNQMDQIDMDARVTALENKLLEANEWLKRVNSQWPVAFTVVGFANNRPFSMLISNAMDLHGQFFNPLLSELKVFPHRPKEPEARPIGDLRAVTSEELKKLRSMLVKNHKPLEIQAAMADVNVAAAKRSATISGQCVTGHLLLNGAAEVIPHGVDPKVEYLPRFVQRYFTANGILGVVPKVGQDGKPLPPGWEGMTAKVQGRGRENMVVATIHSFRNVQEAIVGQLPHNVHIAIRVAEENEPRQVTFEIQKVEEPIISVKMPPPSVVLSGLT